MIGHLPELRVPATSIVRAPSTRKLMMPAPSGVIILFWMNKGSVHGLSRCLRSAYASPEGFKGAVIAATRARAFGNTSSVSRIGFASSNGRPDKSLNFDAHESPSPGVGIMFVKQSS